MKLTRERPVAKAEPVKPAPAVVVAEQPQTTKHVEAPPKFEGAPQTAHERLTQVATAAATEAAMSGDAQHPLLERFGESVGLTLGVIVTELLAVSKEWNAPLKGPDGKPVEHIEGADRIGNHDLRKRHQEVVGPKVAAYVATLHPGMVHDLLDGLARGATTAPGASYRLEAGIDDWLHGAK